jgi:phosphatidylglycerol---prolipoprotein diacylglyceryl transferase
MIPYIHFERLFQTLHLPFQIFGALVICAAWVGVWQTQKRARQLGLDAGKTSSMFWFSIVVGFIAAHLFDVVAYQWTDRAPPLRIILNPFAGLSSYGGLGGTLLGMVLWCKWSKQPVMPYVDSAAFGLAPGWFVGRLGCFAAHDHPGRLTDFVLAVNYPDGPRHDLGLYEAFVALGFTILFWILARKKQPVGLYATLICLIYGPARFLLDYLRAADMPGSDPRYFGFTPGQYSSIAIFLVGVLLLARPAPTDR